MLSVRPIVDPAGVPLSGIAQPHPSLARRSLVWWAGDRAGALLGTLDPQVASTVALSQGQVARNSGFVATVRRRGLGLLLDGEAWRAQLPVDHPHRTRSFHALDWVDSATVHRPTNWSERALEDFAESYIEQQTAYATLLTTPAHHDFEPVGPLRRRELDLAAMCADHVRARALREPHPDDHHRQRRQLLASLMLRAGRLDETSTAWLTAAYSSLDVDGYLIWAVDFTSSQAQTVRLLALAEALQARTGYPVLLAGIGHLWQLALARGVAGAVFGQRSALRWPDETLRRPGEDEEDDEEDGFGVAIYHGAVLSCTRIGRPGEVVRRRLFLRHPCPCGHHPPSEPPADQPTIRAHNQWWIMRDGRHAGLADSGRAVALLAERAVAAAERREALGMSALVTGWRALLPPQPMRRTGSARG